MKVQFSETQCKTSLLAIRCQTAAIAALLHKDAMGQQLMDKTADLLHRVGHGGANLADADLSQNEADTLLRALNAAHFILVLSKTLNMSDADRQQTLKAIRQCMTAITGNSR